MKKLKNTVSIESRRKFLKKTVYATPSLIVLGSLSKPTDLFGDGDTSGIPNYKVLGSPSPAATGLTGKNLGP